MERHIFRGSRTQRGYGLGGFFTSLMRRAIPLFKSGGRYLTGKAARTGLRTFQDVMAGAEPRMALKRRLAETSDEMFDDIKRKIRRKMTGEGIRRGGMRRKTKRLTKSQRVGKKRKNNKSKKRKTSKPKKKACNRKIKDIFEM